MLPCHDACALNRMYAIRWHLSLRDVPRPKSVVLRPRAEGDFEWAEEHHGSAMEAISRETIPRSKSRARAPEAEFMNAHPCTGGDPNNILRRNRQWLNAVTEMRDVRIAYARIIGDFQAMAAVRSVGAGGPNSAELKRTAVLGRATGFNHQANSLITERKNINGADIAISPRTPTRCYIMSDSTLKSRAEATATEGLLQNGIAPAEHPTRSESQRPGRDRTNGRISGNQPSHSKSCYRLWMRCSERICPPGHLHLGRS